MWYSDTRTFDGESFDFEIYFQGGGTADILFVHHGSSRSIYSSGSESIAEREDLSVFSPIFPRASYDSDAYQRGGIVNDDDRVLPEEEWTTRFEAPMVDWARGEVGGEGQVYLFGHSAGGQYLSRVAAYERPQDVDRIVIANPSTWVLPSLEEDAPYGFDGLGTDAEERQALQDYLALPMTIYLGSEDDDPNDPTMSTGSAAMRQGATRLERGLNTFEMGQEVAAANGWAFNWDLVIAEGVTHSGSAMLRAPEMVEALQPDPIVVNTAPQDLVLSGSLVDEDAEPGTVIGQLSATDPDGDPLSFGVAGDPRFAVDGSGRLVVAPGADLEGEGDRGVTLTLSASDGRGGVVEMAAEVTILDVAPTVTDPADTVDLGDTVDTVDPADPVAPADPIGEAGRVTFAQADGSQWHAVAFAQALDDPAVVMGGLSFDGVQAGTLRVRNVTETGFEFQLDEWDYLDGRHVTETASWIAVERGAHVLSNGMVIEAGSATASGSRSRIDFEAEFGSAPTVLAQVASADHAEAVTERLQDVGASGFSVRLDQEEREAKSPHGRESLDWIALETGGSAGAGMVVGRSGDVVTDAPHRIAFADAFAVEDYALLADMQTRQGGDTADLRVSAIDRTGASLFVHEEQSRDHEIRHKAEDVGFVGIETGLIHADPLFG